MSESTVAFLLFLSFFFTLSPLDDTAWDLRHREINKEVRHAPISSSGMGTASSLVGLFLCFLFFTRATPSIWVSYGVRVSQIRCKSEDESAPSIASSFSLFFSFFRLFFRSSLSSISSWLPLISSVLFLRFLLAFLWEDTGSRTSKIIGSLKKKENILHNPISVCQRRSTST